MDQTLKGRTDREINKKAMTAMGDKETSNDPPPTNNTIVHLAKSPKEQPPKKKKSDPMETSRQTEWPKVAPKAERPPKDKGKNMETASNFFHPRRKEDYGRMLKHFREKFEEVDCDTTVITRDIINCQFVEDVLAQVSFSLFIDLKLFFHL